MLSGRGSAFAYRDYRTYQISRFLFTVAIQMLALAVGWELYEATRKPLSLGYVGLAQFLPTLILSLVGGHLADRFKRHLVVAGCQVLFALCALALFARSTFGSLAIWPVYVVLSVVGVMRAFYMPAALALTPTLVPRALLPNAVASGQAVLVFAIMSGPALGGVVYGVAQRASVVYLLCAALAGSAMALNLTLRPAAAPAREPPSIGRLLAGIRYVWAHKILLGALTLDLFAMLFGGAVALLPVYARDILHVGPSGLGLLRCAPAVGAALTTAAFAVRPLTRRTGPLMLASAAVFGLSTVVFSLSTNIVLSLASLMVVGASDVVSMVIRQTLVQVETPDDLRGRVTAVSVVFVATSNELGEMESGVTAAWLGTVPAVAVGGIASCLVVALWSLLFPQLRRADHLVDRTR
jgi:MFS family permease